MLVFRTKFLTNFSLRVIFESDPLPERTLMLLKINDVTTVNNDAIRDVIQQLCGHSTGRPTHADWHSLQLSWVPEVKCRTAN